MAVLGRLGKKDQISQAVMEYFNLRRDDGEDLNRFGFDLEFTKRITLLVRELDRNFGNIVLLVNSKLESGDRGELGIQVYPELNANSKNFVIELSRRDTTEFIEGILISEHGEHFHEGIRMLVNHEIGHIRAKRLGLSDVKAGEITIDPALFEPLAHLYALGNAADPIKAMASASAICNVVEDAVSVEDTVREWLDYLYFNVSARRGDNDEEGTLSTFLQIKTNHFGYLREDAEQEIIRIAKELLPLAESVPHSFP